jgi:hypothetical protein
VNKATKNISLFLGGGHLSVKIKAAGEAAGVAMVAGSSDERDRAAQQTAAVGRESPPPARPHPQAQAASARRPLDPVAEYQREMKRRPLVFGACLLFLAAVWW